MRLRWDRRRRGQLGDFRSDFINAVAIVTSRAKAESIMRGFEDLVATRAKAGAEAAIPRIRKEVERTAGGLVKPYVYAAVGASAVAFVIAVLAWKRAARR